MFQSIPDAIRQRMAYLEAVDARDRQDQTPKMERLRQIPPQTGRLLALLAASAPPGQLLEIGTSAGYSALWLSLACIARAGGLITFELLPKKVGLAQETFRAAGVEPLVKIVAGDVLAQLPGYAADIAFCFLDTEKNLYAPCYNLVVPNLVPGGFLVADNTTSHASELAGFLEKAYADPQVDALEVPIGQGLLVCRKS